MAQADLGRPIWHDLSVPDPGKLAPFYQAVCGWTASPHDMGDYDDFDLSTAAGDRVAGLCHAKDENAGLPPVWMMYVAVASLSDALGEVARHGGTVLEQRGTAFAIIQDPAGAHFALVQASA